MSSRMTSPGSARPSTPEHGITVLVTTLTHGLKLGVLLRRQLLCTVNATVLPPTGVQLIWL